MPRGPREWMAVLLLTTVAGCADGPTEPELPTYSEVRELADHREIDIRFDSDGAVLEGTLYLPRTGTGFSTVAVSQGSAWTTRATWDEVQGFVLGLDVGAFSFDKRGLGNSGGTPVPVEPHAAFDILADDLVAAARSLRGVELVDGGSIGVFGSSQGGWVVPLAANRDRSTVSFAIVTVGGAFSSGQEGLYDDLTGYSVCARTPMPMNEILDSLRAVGPSGFDPRASLEALTQPTLWMYGEIDFSHSAEFSVEKLEEIQAVQTKPWTVVTVPNANHDFIEGGSICQTTGPVADILTPLREWKDDVLGPA